MLTNLVLNVVLISNFLFNQSLSVSEQAIMVIVVIIQTVSILLGCFTLSAWSDCFTRGAGLIYCTQLRASWTTKNSEEPLESANDDGGGKKPLRLLLPRRAVMIVAKLKLMAFFEQLCPTDGAKTEFRFTFGHLAKINPTTLYEFAYFYSGWIFYIAKMIRNGRL